MRQVRTEARHLSLRDHGCRQLLGRRRPNLSVGFVGMETAADCGAAVRELKGTVLQSLLSRPQWEKAGVRVR